uniref:Uncharacterized protein n=1 Tax=Nothobranchius furzeri TaxID=105023 RepID=A0A1A8U917_NOTFU
MHVLMTDEGKYVVVQRSSKEQHQLAAVDTQSPGTSVEIKTDEDSKKVAFCFVHKSTRYIVKKHEKTLKLEPSSEPRPDNIWFSKENLDGSEHYGLSTQAETKLYVTLCGKRAILCFSEDNSECVQFNDTTV